MNSGFGREMIYSEKEVGTRAAMIKGSQEYKQAMELSDDEDSEDEDDRVSEGADENFEPPPRKRRPRDEDDENIESIRKRPKSDEGIGEADPSDEEDHGYSDEVVETPNFLQTQVIFRRRRDPLYTGL